MLLHLGADRGHHLAPSNRFLLLGKFYFVEEGGEGPVERLHPLIFLPCKLLCPRHVPKVSLIGLDSNRHLVDHLTGVYREVVLVRGLLLNRGQVLF